MINHRNPMRRISIRAYWIAVASNVLALYLLLYGLVRPPQPYQQELAVLLTGISLVCWMVYFRRRNE